MILYCEITMNRYIAISLPNPIVAQKEEHVETLEC